MNIEATVIEVSERGVRVRIGDGAPIWLPRSGPGIEWSSPPEPDIVAYVRLPAWLIAKHRQLQELRFQRAFALQAPLEGLDPEKAKGPLPMAADYPPDAGKGFLSRDDKYEPGSKRPEFTGKLSIHGAEYRLAAWVREKDGKRYFSISAREMEQRSDARQQQAPQERQQAGNVYAQSTGRDDRHQQRPAGGPTFDDDGIPFAPEVR